MPRPATPAMPTQEKSSLRNTFSMSRWAIMLPAVERRSPAMITPPSNSMATIVVPCGRSPGTCAAVPLAPGSRSGADVVRKSAKDEVPTLRHAAVNCPPRYSAPTRFLPVECCLRQTLLPREPHLCRCSRRSDQLSANRAGSLPALLDVGADELLGVLLKDLIDFVEDRLHIIAELLLALLHLRGRLGGRVLGLFAAPGGLPLAASVLRCHTILRGPGRPRRPQPYPRHPAPWPTLRGCVSARGGLTPGPSGRRPSPWRCGSGRSGRPRGPWCRAVVPGSARAAGSRARGCRRSPSPMTR